MPGKEVTEIPKTTRQAQLLSLLYRTEERKNCVNLVHIGDQWSPL
jgi:hypothetical protein